MNPYQVVEDFEAALCEYTGAPYAVTTTSCTMALLLACAWHIELFHNREITIPKRTYVSVPMSIIHAGGKVLFRDEEWTGTYQLWPYPIWDSARRFTSDMYRKGRHDCLSFHWGKILGIQQGGSTGTRMCESLAAVLLGLPSAWGFRHAAKKGLVHPDTTPDEIRALERRITAEPLTALVTLPMAFVGPVFWELSWLSYVPITRYLERRQRRWKT